MQQHNLALGVLLMLILPLSLVSAGSAPDALPGKSVDDCLTRSGSEVVRLLKDEKVRVFTENAGWCWFQDPRVVLHGGKLVMGGVQGNGAGSAIVGVYDLDVGRNLGQVVIHEGFDRDDHNAPAFYRRPDGRLLAVYARHNRDRNHHYRFSEPDNYLDWGKEHLYRHDYPGADGVTYMNLQPMSAEGRLYNFYRGIAFNPCFITSQDQGETWAEPTHFIANEVGGRQRPYARYVGNGTDTVHVSFTDAHPRDYANSIYYAAFRGGKFYRANGEQIKDLKQSGPLRPSEADKVFQGGAEMTPEGTVENRAWTSSIALDADEHPHLAYSVHRGNSDHRYRMAFWDGAKWTDREVAYAGACLYAKESSYTGLITLDPGDPTFVVLSTDVNPSTGEDSGGKHEVYCARVAPDDDISTIQWQPLTQDSEVQNIRPIIVRDDTRRVILWLRGRFSTYTDYELDVVGTVQRVPE